MVGEDVRAAAELVAAAIATAVIILICAFLVGCASPATRVRGAENSYEFYVARVAEECPPPSSDACKARKAWLQKFSKAVDEAGAALKRTGPMPLQLRRLAEIEGEKP